jgi:transposase InsO family protein
MLKEGNAQVPDAPKPGPDADQPSVQHPAQAISEAVAQAAQEAIAQPAEAAGAPEAGEKAAAPRVVTAKRRNHVWHVDLTAVAVLGGFWVPWFPLTVPQWWPHCWWVAVVVDHFSRRIMGLTVFKQVPTSEAMRAFLGRAIRKAREAPKYLICDKGSQFWCEGFKTWCKQKGIRPRFGAIGKHGSIAVIERLILTLKIGCMRRLRVSYGRDEFLRELLYFADWYNKHRPHATLGGRTPHEVYEGLPAANRAPRFEPRPGWPRASACARPQTLIKGQPGARLEFQVTYYRGRKHLPIVHVWAAS